MVSYSNDMVKTGFVELVLITIFYRLSWADCQRGIVFDGVECKFTSSQVHTTKVILQALGDRPFIYVVDLKITMEQMIEK